MNRPDAFARRCKRHFVRWLTAVAALLATSGAVEAETVLRIVMNSDLKILDPIWNTAFVIRDHGYMIYDTLFATDADGEIRPQMVDKTEVSADKLTYRFTLRDGLKWHDGQPVTAEDCVASIKRWAARDAVGQKLMTFVTAVAATDASTIEIRLKEPTGLLLPALGKPNSNVPFMMPRRVAETDPFTQITDSTGSGPFIFKRDQWRPGHLAVYVRNPEYKPRPEPVSRLAGGKVAKVDRIEWHAMPDHLQAINALQAGEVDFLEAPPFDLHALLRADRNIQLLTLSPVGSQNIFRLNHLHKPFDNPTVRRALWYAFNQEDFLKAVIGDPAKYKVCKTLFICGTPYASDKGMDGLLESHFDKAASLLKQAGYDGTPVVLLQSSDLFWQTNLAPVAKRLMEKSGFKVDMQPMDWQSIVIRTSRKNPPEQGGWHAYLISPSAMDLSDPVSNRYLNSSCDKAFNGWPCDPEMEKLRDRFARETDPAKLKEIAELAQIRATEWTPYVHLGEWRLVSATRRNVSGFISAGPTVFWNVEKK
jgi:peptide/nickel transport system substrate-binding protein